MSIGSMEMDSYEPQFGPAFDNTINSNRFASSSSNNIQFYDVSETENRNFFSDAKSAYKDDITFENVSVSYPNSTEMFNFNLTIFDEFTANTSSADGNTTQPPPYNLPKLGVEIQIALYSIIFVVALVGNILIIVTLIQNKRMRTVTNVFLLNLAISDLLLALVCMPFTLVPVLLMDFIFGRFMCVLIRYLQAVSVAVSCFTLVAISMERFFAICRPLHSRSWQTLSHAYRCIAVCWILAAALTIPTAVFQKHRALASGRHSCRESWPNIQSEQAYTVLLDLVLLVLPVIIMSAAYSKVVHVLIFDTRTSMDVSVSSNGQGSTFVLPNYRTIELRLLSRDSCRSVSSYTSTDTTMSGTVTPPRGNLSRSVSNSIMTSPSSVRRSRHSVHNRIRHSNPQRIRQNKMRVIRMLFVVVLEFFICWTPVYVLNTWMIFHPKSAYEILTPMTKTLLHLLSYTSSCCNPVTYCFMNKKFREAFLRVFTCRGPPTTLRERRMQQLQQEQLTSRDRDRRGTAVSRLSERFNPMGSVTSASLAAESVRVRNPGIDRCKKMATTVEEDTSASE